MSIQIEGAYFKMDLPIIQVNSVLLVLHQQPGYVLIRDCLPTSMLGTFVQTTRMYIKYAAGSVKICSFLALM
jgi:hypothetical protein